MTKYIFICSHRHSGSTLLDLILGSHSKIESLGEISFLSQDLALNTPCSCGTPVRQCKVWVRVVERLSATTGLDIMANPYALHLGYPKAHVIVDHTHQTPAYLMRRELMLGMYYMRLRFGARLLDPLLAPLYKSLVNTFMVYDAVRAVLGADIVVDTSKYYLKAIGVYLQNPNDVRVILLTRDGRGVLYSAIKRNQPRDPSVNGWIKQYTRSLPLFKQHVRAEHLLYVKYENIVADPVREMTRVCQFLGIPFEPAMLDFASVAHHSTHGNVMRFRRSSAIRADNEWQQGLSKDDLGFFERRAGWLNRQLGYT